MNIREIAAAAKVSVATVSKILNNKDQDISDATRKRVLNIVKEYQYTPYSNLKDASQTAKSNLLGFLMEVLLDNEVLFDMEKVISENGYSMIVCNLNRDMNLLSKYMNIMAAKKAEGIVLWGQSNKIIEAASELNKTNIPLITISNKQCMKHPTVYYEYEKTSYLATKHLIDHGHIKIGCLLDSSDTELANQARDGYLKALFEASILKEDDNIFSGNTPLEVQRLGVQQLIDRNVTAIYCQNSLISSITYSLLKERGIRIPDDISVVSGENGEHREYFTPHLTTVIIPYEELANLAVTTLVDNIENRSELPMQSSQVNVILKEGDSTAAPTGTGKKIIVVGNINMDVLINTELPPVSGHMVMANSIVSVPGGKATDQAIGVGKLGGLVYIIGRVGNDVEGKIIINTLVESLVKTDGVMLDATSSTGKAFITVSANQESAIISYPGANVFFDSKQIKRCGSMFRDANMCLITTEIGAEVVDYSIKLCKKHDVAVCVKPSNTANFNIEMLNKIDYFIPNEKELNQMLPQKISMEEKANYFFDQGVKNVIVTLAAKGCYLKNEKYSMYFPAADFPVVDTTGAANAFIAALAVSLSYDNNIIYSICFATYAAGISIIQNGVHSSFADRKIMNLYQDDINSLYGLFQDKI